MATVLYDGDCTFCKKWIHWLEVKTGGRVNYLEYQTRPERFRKISDADLSQAVHMVEDDGTVIKGARVFFRCLEISGQRLGMRLYRFPIFRGVSERFYGLVARNRVFFSYATYYLWGEDVRPPTYFGAATLFLKGLALCYLSAFISLGAQIKGLVGPDGVYPVAQWLSHFPASSPLSGFFRLPTLGWFGASNGFLLFQCGAGAIFAVMLLLGVFSRFAAAGAWLLYLSLINACGVFLGFQWESLLMEAGFLALWLAPWGGLKRRKYSPPVLLIFLYRWLLFRLMFSSGLAKWVTHDPTWRSFTALNYHFQTQPLPTWVAWYSQKLPETILKGMTVSMFVIEIFVPLLFFLPRRPRIVAFWLQLALQLAIALNGNYTYFNFLTAALCLFLLDDAALGRLPVKIKNVILPGERASPAPKKRIPLKIAAVFYLLTGFALIPWPRNETDVFSRLAAPLIDVSYSWRLVSGYGLFASMTTVRNEIVIEGSDDGVTWREYEFPWKPGDVTKKPAFVAPHQPRLDWQAWFAALSSFDENTWLQNLCLRLLQGEPEVLKLFKSVPFPGAPPKILRVQLYEYEFSDSETKLKTGAWWTRRLVGPYSPEMKLK